MNANDRSAGVLAPGDPRRWRNTLTLFLAFSAVVALMSAVLYVGAGVELIKLKETSAPLDSPAP